MDVHDPNNWKDASYDSVIEIAARLAHEANRAYCQTLGDFSLSAWEEAPEWQRATVFNGVLFHHENPNADASASHENWFAEKQADGWSYGPVKDPENKRHPCFVPFSELPVEQQIKDHIFRSTVHAAFHAFHSMWNQPGT